MNDDTIGVGNINGMNQHVMVEQIFELSPDCMFVFSRISEKFIHVNKNACILFGYTKANLLQLNPKKLFNNHLDFDTFYSIHETIAVGATTKMEFMGKSAEENILFLQLQYSKINTEQALIVIRDVSEQQQVQLLNRELSEIVELQEEYNYKVQVGRQVLKMVATQQPLNNILDVLCKGTERLLEGIRVAIFRVNEGQLSFAAAPKMPQEFIAQIDGMPVHSTEFPCTSAIYNKESIIIEDLQNDTQFGNYQNVAKEYNIRACWAIPIFSSSGVDVLGSFAFYSDKVIKQNFAIDDLIAMVTDLASVAVEQDNNRISLTTINKQYAKQNKELQEIKLQLEADKNILLDREEKLKEAQRLSKVGSWQWDMTTNQLNWSRQQYLTYGLEGTPKEVLYKAYQQCIHPDDRYNLTNAITATSYPTKIFHYEHRITTAGGQLRYILGKGRVEYNQVEEVIVIKATEQDVTSLKLAEKKALDSELQFNELMANINEVVFVMEVNNVSSYDNPVVYINGDTLDIFGYTHDELMNNSNIWVERLHPEDRATASTQRKTLLATKKQVTREYRFKHRDGYYVWIEDNLSIGNNKEVEGGYKIYGSARDISMRKASEAASQEIQERLELVLKAANLGNYDWKVKEDNLHWDDRMHELYGLDKEKAADWPDKNMYIESILHPDDRENMISNYIQSIEPIKSVSNFKNSYRIIVDGRIKHIESYVIILRDEHKNVRRIIGACLDVTERKEVETLSVSNEEKAVLLKEIHHRVKNNLQVITSLLSLQSNFLKDQKQRKIFADSQYRINSMAIVHELLYQSNNLAKLNYKDYLKKLSQYLISSIKGLNNKVELKLDVGNIKLSIDTAIPLGLLINEVITNSLKYGIPEDNAGCISIKIYEAVEDKKRSKKPSFILEIGDDGVGFPNTVNYRNSKSLGLKLIHNLTRQLEGTITKDLNKKGINYIIAFKEI
ncbi:MAG: PAS domain-containing protein [Aureispira sp.]